jgi:hypothetical protein
MSLDAQGPPLGRAPDLRLRPRPLLGPARRLVLCLCSAGVFARRPWHASRRPGARPRGPPIRNAGGEEALALEALSTVARVGCRAPTLRHQIATVGCSTRRSYTGVGPTDDVRGAFDPIGTAGHTYRHPYRDMNGGVRLSPSLGRTRASGSDGGGLYHGAHNGFRPFPWHEVHPFLIPAPVSRVERRAETARPRP